MHGLISLWNTIQSTLFPWLEEELDPLTEKQKHFVSVIELMNPEPFLKQFNWIGNGRKPKKRLNLLKAFVAKADYDFTTTEILVEHLKSCKNLNTTAKFFSESLQPGVHRLAFQSQYSENTLMDPPVRFFSNESLQGFHAKRKFSQGQGALCTQ